MPRLTIDFHDAAGVDPALLASALQRLLADGLLTVADDQPPVCIQAHVQAIPSGHATLASGIRDWAISDHGRDERPDEPSYEVDARCDNQAVAIEIRPSDWPANHPVERLPRMALIIEISEGVPALHIFGPDDVREQSIRALPEGMVAQPGDDGPQMRHADVREELPGVAVNAPAIAARLRELQAELNPRRPRQDLAG